MAIYRFGDLFGKEAGTGGVSRTASLGAKPCDRRAMVRALAGITASGLGLSLLGGCAASMVHSGASLDGRRLLSMSIERTFAQLAATGGFWNGAYRLAVPAPTGRHDAAYARARAAPDFQRNLNMLAYKAVLEARGMLLDAADGLPLKFGKQAYRDNMSITLFMRRSFGTSLSDVLFSDLFALAGGQATGTGQPSVPLDVLQALAHEAGDALWRMTAANETALRRDPGVLDAQPLHVKT